MRKIFKIFSNPPREFGLIPFWFWNDDLDEGELMRQLHAFHQAGFGGVLPHARVGLSRRVGYLTDEFFRLMRRVVEEAARLDMKIILYDEASYPSGSAKGAVVAENPDYASQAIGLWEKEIEGPFDGFWRPHTGRALLDRHVCTILGEERRDGSIDASTLTILEPEPNTIFHLDVPAGKWRAMSVWNTHSGGHIRGAFPEEESGHATAPAAGDILNPEAVACFIRLTHEQYYQHLKEFFGTTIIALFTDEPHVFGKGTKRPPQAQPFTPGLVQWLQERWDRDPRPWLPSLWRDFGPETENFRRDYARAIQDRLHEVFYAAQSQWCAEHGIALTGHPSGSDELSSLRYFQMAGQDMVWRWVLPNSPSALEGAHSLAAKAATSGARLSGSRRILTEVCGAYGWQLSPDEIKWLFDWHLVRGNNLINPHAVFYSIRERRAWESEPDLGVHNVWWPHFHHLATYAKRLCWLLSDGEQVCDVAVLGDGNSLPWAAAKQLYQNQIDFLYLDDQAVAEAKIDGGFLCAGIQRYRAIIVDGNAQLEQRAREKLTEFETSGGAVLYFEASLDLPAELDRFLPRDLYLTPAHPDLRFMHYRREDLDFYLLVNEGEDAICGELQLNLNGDIEIWDAYSGAKRLADTRPTSEGLCIDLQLERRQSVVLVVNTKDHLTPPPEPAHFAEERVALDLSWKVTDPAGNPVAAPAPGDWSKHSNLELFSGTLCYHSDLELPSTDEIWLDLGQVGDIAEVFLNGDSINTRMWAPYHIRLADHLPSGPHHLEIRVTNSMANAYEGLQLPSGLIGPLALVLRHRQ